MHRQTHRHTERPSTVTLAAHDRRGLIRFLAWPMGESMPTMCVAESILCFSLTSRMLNYTGYICAIRSATSTFGEGTGSVWLNNLACRYYDTTLDRCRNSNPYNINPCTHSRDAALICQGVCVVMMTRHHMSAHLCIGICALQKM